jgi:hypothetical protein
VVAEYELGSYFPERWDLSCRWVFSLIFALGWLDGWVWESSPGKASEWEWNGMGCLFFRLID